jgi:hypothetical protein
MAAGAFPHPPFPSPASSAKAEIDELDNRVCTLPLTIAAMTDAIE